MGQRDPGVDLQGGVVVHVAPLGETADHWIPIGLHADLDEAMREAVREVYSHDASMGGAEKG